MGNGERLRPLRFSCRRRAVRLRPRAAARSGGQVWPGPDRLRLRRRKRRGEPHSLAASPAAITQRPRERLFPPLVAPKSAGGGRRRAVFLDRDGVLCHLVQKRDGSHDSALHPREVRIVRGTKGALRKLKRAGFLLVLASNQPIVAKGKASAREFGLIHAEFRRKLGVGMDGFYYCLHHPEGKGGELGVACGCRKPMPGLLFAAAQEHGIDLGASWMVGDSGKDMLAGKAAGCRCIMVESQHRGGRGVKRIRKESGGAKPDYFARDISEAVGIILRDGS